MLRPILALTLAAIAVAAPAAKRDNSDEAKIARQLNGLVPGQPQACVSASRSGGESHYGNTVLVRGQGGTLYRSQFQNGCQAPSDFTLVTRRFGSQLCRGDIVQVVDLQSGIERGACTYSEFVPYRRPK